MEHSWFRFRVLETPIGVPLGQIGIAVGPTIPNVCGDGGTTVLKAVAADRRMSVESLTRLRAARRPPASRAMV